MKRLVIVIWLVLIMMGLVSCKYISGQQNQKWGLARKWINDLRKQFEECKAKFYVEYPDEIIRTDWHKCMENKQESEHYDTAQG